MNRKLPLILLLGFLHAAPAGAQDLAEPQRDDAGQEVDRSENEAYDRFRLGTTDLQTLAEVLPLLADPEKRAVIRGALLEVDDPPRQDLVALLGHPTLAVRLGSLELLEELSGGDFSYNPWTPAGSADNAGALARWRQWAGEPNERAPGGALFSEEQRRAYLQDLLAEDRDKASRARRMLEAEGLSAVGFLETFLQETPTLSVGHRARIREAQYQITLSKQLGDQAADTARHLAFGSRDQLLSALATARSAGLLGLPILRDFITHPDPLVRETAIDSMLLSGGEQAVAVIAPILAKEPDTNVIHGALRRLKDIKGKPASDLAASFLNHPDEDLLVSAIQTCLSLAGDSENASYSSSSRGKSTPSASDSAVVAALADPRWRVRAVALEYITTRRVASAKDACIAALADPDEFVRFAAIRAIGALGAAEALPKLKEMLMTDASMAGPVIEGYATLKRTPDEALLKVIDAAPVDSRLAALRAIESNSSLAPIALRYAADADLDVACAALRYIAANSDLIEKPAYASVLVAALRSGVAEKMEAVMERLSLPSSGGSRRGLSSFSVVETEETGPTTLDSLYDAFLLPGIDEAPEVVVEIPAARAELIKELIARTTPETPASDRFRAGLNLARSGIPDGFSSLSRDLPTLTTAQKIAVAEAIYEPKSPDALAFLQAMLRDSVPEVRSAAASSAFSSEDSLPFVQIVLDELIREGTQLQPWEVYSYAAEAVARSQKSNSTFRKWMIAVIASEERPAPLRILALIFSREIRHADCLQAVKSATDSSAPHIRRAAWNTLITARPAEIQNVAAAIAADEDAFVRAALPRVFTGSTGSWTHRFSDAHIVSDSRWTHNDTKPRSSPDLVAILTKLATTDAAPLLRFEANMALLNLGAPVDLNSLVTLVSSLPKELGADARVTRWMGENASRATPALRPLLAILNPSVLRPQQLQEITRRVNPERGESGFATFASLAEAAAEPIDQDQPLLNPVADEVTPAPRESLAIVYFYKPGCPECIRAKREIDSLKSAFPLMEITGHNLLEAESTVLNQALCDRFSVPSAQHTLSPAVFTQSGFLIRNDINPVALAGLFSETSRLPQDDSWMRVDAVEITAAAGQVDRRYQALTLPVVIIAGLLDGINPCAFATIIFFLSYLQIARRTPREMLMVGAAFISAVFIAYLTAGLILYSVLDALNERFAGIQEWMNYSFATLALVAAAYSFRDAYRARGGRLDEMTLQLPAFLKTRIRGVIRSGAKARNFVIAAFISGLLISLLELACTGQVYAPIIYQIQQGRLDAIAWLVTYNLAFVAPLIVIFLLAYGGLRSETLIGFQKRHTTSVKLALGLLFVVLAGVILFGHRLLGS